MSLGRRISPDPVGGNFGNVTGFDSLYDHGTDPLAALLVPPFSLFSLKGQELTTDLPPELSPPLKSIRLRGNPDKWELVNNLDLGPGEFTLALFFRKVDAECDTDAALASKGQVGAGEWALSFKQVGSGNDTVGFSMGGAAFDVESNTGVVNDEIFHHVAVTRNAANLISLYVDGSFEDSTTDATDLTNSELLRFGVKNTGSDFFGGSLTGGLLYLRGMDATEILNLADGNVEPNPASHFRFAPADILSAPFSNHGTLNGGAFFDVSTLPGQLQDRTGAAEILPVSFDGTNDWLNVPDNIAIRDLTKKTISIWFFAETTGGSAAGRWIHKATGGGSTFGWSVFFTGGKLRFLQDFASTERGIWEIDATIVLDRWQYLAITYDLSDVANDPIFYLDGVSVAFSEIDTPVGVASSDSGNDLVIGNWGAVATRAWDGWLADPELFSRILSAAEVTNIFNQVNLPTDAIFAGFSNTGLIEDAEPGAPAGTVGTQYDGADDSQAITPVTFLTGIPFSVSFRFSGRANTDILGTTTTNAITRLSATVIRVKIASVNSDFTVPNMVDDAWFNATITRDSSNNVRCFLAGTESVTGAIVNTGTFTITTLGGANAFWDGLLEDIQIHNIDLSAAEALDYSNRITTDEGLINNWPLATEGNIVEDNVGNFANTLEDAIGGSAQGTLVNFVQDPNLSWRKSVPAQLVGQQTFSLLYEAASTQHVTIPGAPIYGAGGAFTISAFIKLTALGVKHTVLGSAANANDSLNINASDLVTLRVNGIDHVGLTPITETDAWIHVAATRSAAGAITIYLRGVDDTSGTPSESSAFSPVVAGAVNTDITPADLLDGSLCELRSYGNDLSAADIALLSAGQDPTTQPLGKWRHNDARTFETIDAWGVDILADTDRYNSADVAEGVLFEDSDFTEVVILSATNTTGITAATLIPALTQQHDGTLNSGVRFLQLGNNTARFEKNTDIPLELAFIEFDSNGFELPALDAVKNGPGVGAGTINVHHCIIHNSTRGNGIRLNGNAASICHHNFLFAMSGISVERGLIVELGNFAFNNTLLGGISAAATIGIEVGSGGAEVSNNIIADFDTDYSGQNPLGGNNISSDDTAKGSNPLINQLSSDLLANVTAGSEDLHLKEDSPAILFGLNLLNTGHLAIGIDIDRDVRPTVVNWDAGADQLFVPPPAPGIGGGGATIISRTRRRRRVLMAPVR